MSLLAVVIVGILSLIFQLLPVSSKNLRNYTINYAQVMKSLESAPRLMQDDFVQWTTQKNGNEGIRIIPTILKYSKFEDTCLLMDPKDLTHLEVPCLLFLRNSLKQFSLNYRSKV